MSNVILYRMPYGIPGDVTRQSMANIETQIFDPSATFAAYGLAGYMDSNGKFAPISGPNETMYGVLVRPYPTQGINASDPLGTSVPLTYGPANVLRRGYINVLNNNGTAKAGGQVYVRVANPSGSKVIGGFEAALDASSSAHVGNTGNGTFGAITIAAAGWVPGSYTAKFTAATTYSVYNPNGDLISTAGATGTALTVDGMTFTITAGGTAFAAGDYFTFGPNHIAPLNSYFAGAADASGNVELGYNI